MKNPGIYILTSPSGKQYVGRDSNLPKRVKKHFSGNAPQCRNIHRAIKKYGADAFSVEIIQYPGISQEALNAVERWWIRRLQTLAPKGCNLTEGGEGVIPSEETRQKFSESARLEQKKRVENGTHHFLDSEFHRQNQKKRVENGTHHFIGDEHNKKRVEEGTHHFLGGEIQRRNARKSVENGTHNFLGDEHNKKRVEEGTHHFLGGEIQRRNARKSVEDGTHNFLGDNNPVHKQIADGTHNFLGDNNPVHKQIADGTHPFLGGDIQRRTNKKRVEDGTHPFLGDNNPIKRLAKEGRHPQTRKRLKGEWCYIIALSRFWYEIHDYTLKRRAEFLSEDIPDTSHAKQVYLF